MWKAENPLILRENNEDVLLFDTPVGKVSWKTIRRGLTYVHNEQVRREALSVIRKAAALKAIETKRRNKLKQGELP